MASSDSIPSRETELLPYSQNFSARITATPVPYGFTAAEATTLAGLVTAFATALAAALNPVTKTKSTVASKNLAKAQMLVVLRSYAKRVQANPAVTPSQRTDLGLKIYSSTKTPTPPPATEPLLNVVGVGNRALTVRLADILTPDKRARPAGVDGAEIFAFVPTTPGQQPPAELDQWRFEGLATKAEYEVDFRPDDIGKNAWVIARWYNKKGETGPTSDPIVKMIAA